MDDVDKTVCEIRVLEGWQPISLELALRLGPSRKLRCPICHGRVRVVRAGRDGAAHLEHVVHHRGCHLEEDFDGNPRPHPKAIK